MPHFLAAFLVALFLSAPARADVISVTADIWCPYNCAPADNHPGYGIEILKEIFEKAGHKIAYSNMNWTRSIDRARAGEFTAIIGALYKDAPDFVFPQEPFGVQVDTLATRIDDPFEYRTVESLAGHVLGAIQGYTYDDAFNAYIEKYKDDVKRVDLVGGDDPLTTNIKKLMANRVDVVLDDYNVMSYTLKNMKVTDKVKAKPLPSKRGSLYVAFSPKNPKAKDYAALFDKGVAELRKSGKLKDILARYGLEDWQK